MAKFYQSPVPTLDQPGALAQEQQQYARLSSPAFVVLTARPIAGLNDNRFPGGCGKRLQAGRHQCTHATLQSNAPVAPGFLPTSKHFAFHRFVVTPDPKAFLAQTNGHILAIQSAAAAATTTGLVHHRRIRGIRSSVPGGL